MPGTRPVTPTTVQPAGGVAERWHAAVSETVAQAAPVRSTRARAVRLWMSSVGMQPAPSQPSPNGLLHNGCRVLRGRLPRKRDGRADEAIASAGARPRGRDQWMERPPPMGPPDDGQAQPAPSDGNVGRSGLSLAVGLQAVVGEDHRGHAPRRSDSAWERRPLCWHAGLQEPEQGRIPAIQPPRRHRGAADMLPLSPCACRTLRGQTRSRCPAPPRPHPPHPWHGGRRIFPVLMGRSR